MGWQKCVNLDWIIKHKNIQIINYFLWKLTGFQKKKETESLQQFGVGKISLVTATTVLRLQKNIFQTNDVSALSYFHVNWKSTWNKMSFRHHLIISSLILSDKIQRDLSKKWQYVALGT